MSAHAPRPTAMVGVKFHADGSARSFPGSSIVSMVPPDSRLYRELCWIRERCREEPFAKKLAFLPPSSFHMTLVDLVCDQVRVPEHWSASIPLGCPLDEVDRRLASALEGLAWPAAPRVRVTGTGPDESARPRHRQ